MYLVAISVAFEAQSSLVGRVGVRSWSEADGVEAQAGADANHGVPDLG